MFNFWPFDRQLRIIQAEIAAMCAKQEVCCARILAGQDRIETMLQKIYDQNKITGITAVHDKPQ